MKAVMYAEFGPPEVLGIHEVDRPIPRPGEVLVRVRATTVTRAETLMRRGRPRWGRLILGVSRPRRNRRTLGLEFAGVIEATGADVRRFAPGDQVFGFAGFHLGACAEYVCLPESASLEQKPAGISFEEAAAAVDGPSTALYFLRDRAHVRSGQHVLVNGASGSIGTYAVQLAKHFGAEVTAVCSARNTELVTELGADHVIDYQKEDFSSRRDTYDVIFDTVTAASFARCRRALTPHGCYVPTTGLINWPLGAWTALRGGRTVRPGMSVEKRSALAFVKELIESDGLRIVVDRNFPMDRVVDAHRYVDQGHKVGNVTVTISRDCPHPG
ncbi:NAD(P)-dependent alcohol dehydrogenase [Rhodococcus opacus]|nr:NAD(P)-dependent alcohol dehydrogenase [Rhodococcus opacus]RZL81208.1 MAG: NAD(P)-dependent alcohol dehydrogenase [Rhodococcus sp. (in: high G+C Gram-positive bacteria)]